MAELVGSQTPAMAAMRRVQKIVNFLAAVKRRSQAGCMLLALFLTTQAKPTFSFADNNELLRSNGVSFCNILARCIHGIKFATQPNRFWT